MGILNFAQNRMIKKIVNDVVPETIEIYRNLKAQFPNESEEKILRRLFMYQYNHDEMTMKAKDEEIASKFITSLNTFCYFIAIMDGPFGMELSRQFVIYTQLVDEKLAMAGFPLIEPSEKKKWFEMVFPGPGMDWGLGLKGGPSDPSRRH